MDNEQEILLSICIPTYNRDKYLDLCLSQILKQIKPFENIIEILVSNNCSTDDTDTVVAKYMTEGYKINYIKNSENIGADRNVLNCMKLAKGKYFWFFGDDDVLLDDKLESIVHIINEHTPGIIYLSNFWFDNNYNTHLTKYDLKENKYTVYTEIQTFLKKLNYWSTFGTGNIVNKSLLPVNFDYEKYLHTNLNHVHWVITSAIKTPKNVIVTSIIIACKGGNTGGYKLFTTFSTNFNKIMSEVANAHGIKNDFIKYTNNKLITDFFPQFIIVRRKVFNKEFLQEKNISQILLSNYKYYYRFWFINVPLFILPRIGLSVYARLATKIFRVI